MSVESSLKTQAVASVTAIDANHLVHGDYHEFRPDPPFPRVMFWAMPGSSIPVRTWRGGAQVEKRRYRFWCVDKDASGARGAADCITMANELRAGLDDFEDSGDNICRVLYEQTFDIQEPLDERTHVRVVDFDVFVTL